MKKILLYIYAFVMITAPTVMWALALYSGEIVLHTYEYVMLGIFTLCGWFSAYIMLQVIQDYKAEQRQRRTMNFRCPDPVDEAVDIIRKAKHSR